jgi:pimeloyl-ACP methyl ester carboxylesterase
MTLHPASEQGHAAANGAGLAPAPGVPSWQSVDWREHQRWVTIGGRPINTISLGDGPAILFIHGLSGCWGNWLEQLTVFAATNRVIAIDLPGFGHSPGGAGELSMGGYAQLLDELLEQLGVQSSDVVGNSMGGLIAAELAASFPDRVRRLVLVSPAGLSTYANRLTHRTLPLLRRLEQVLALGAAYTASNSDAIARRPRMRELALKGVVRHPERLSAPLAAEQVRGAGTDGFMRALEAILEHDLSETLPRIAARSLIVWGDHDLLINVRDAARFQELIPDARLVVYEDTGHVSMLERPAEFNELLADFLA